MDWESNQSNDNSEETQTTNFSYSSESESSEDEETMKIDKMNEAILSLQKELVMLYTSESVISCDKVQSESKRLNLLKKIEDIFLDVLTSLVNGNAPKFLIRNSRMWDNCIYNSRVSLKPIGEASNMEINFCNNGSRKKFALIVFVLGKIYKLLSLRTFCTKRELFYQHVNKISVQSELDHILNDITNFLDASLFDLNIFASSKGLVYGPLEIITDNSVIKCNNAGGTTIPYNVSNIKELQCDAHLILLIEKDAIFQKLISENIAKRLGPCLLITGKGFPDINTRYLLKLLWDKLAIPIFALVDPDPWGIEIMCTYRFGSLSMSHQSELLAVPSIRWLGIHPSEIEKFYNVKEPLNKRDNAKLLDILNRPYIKADPLLQKEIQILLDKNYKAEIEGIENTPSHLTKLYIRFKITHNDVL